MFNWISSVRCTICKWAIDMPLLLANLLLTINKRNWCFYCYWYLFVDCCCWTECVIKFVLICIRGTYNVIIIIKFTIVAKRLICYYCLPTLNCDVNSTKNVDNRELCRFEEQGRWYTPFEMYSSQYTKYQWIHGNSLMIFYNYPLTLCQPSFVVL